MGGHLPRRHTIVRSLGNLIVHHGLGFSGLFVPDFDDPFREKRFGEFAKALYLKTFCSKGGAWPVLIGLDLPVFECFCEAVDVPDIFVPNYEPELFELLL